MERKKALKNLAFTITALILAIAAYGFLPRLFLINMKDKYLQGFLAELIFAAAVFAAVLILKKTSIYRSDPLLLARGLPAAAWYLFLLFMIGMAGFSVSGKITITARDFGLFFAEMILVGYCEETLFRGLLQNAFQDLFGQFSCSEARLSVVCAGVLFGAMHLMNAIQPAISLSAALSQSLGAAFLGMLIGAIYLRTGKCLWFCIFLHGINDILAGIATGILQGSSLVSAVEQMGERGLVSDLMSFLVYGLPAFFILRNKKLEPVLMALEEYSSIS